jgi:hypothetical protein
MPYTKTIVCLANSRKLAGRCVAGKEWDGLKIGPWCRPVSAKDRGELTAERWYRRTWRDPQLLDLIEVGLLRPRPSGLPNGKSSSRYERALETRRSAYRAAIDVCPR